MKCGKKWRSSLADGGGGKQKLSDFEMMILYWFRESNIPGSGAEFSDRGNLHLSCNRIEIEIVLINTCTTFTCRFEM